MTYLNLGCGPHLAPAPWINVDQNSGAYDVRFNHAGGERMPDVIAPCWGLPFPDGSCERLYAGHLVEHLTLPDGVARSCAEWKRVLAPGGELLLVAPDLVRIAEDIYRAPAGGWGLFWDAHGTSGRMPSPFRSVIEGVLPGDAHQWSCSREALLLLALWQFPGYTITPLEPADIPAVWPLVSRVAWQAAVLVKAP